MASYLIFAGKVEDVSKVQTLLFSATLPDWVEQVYVIIFCSKFFFCFLILFFYTYGLFPYLTLFCCQISLKFLKPDKKTADLFGNEKMKASTNVRHVLLPRNSSARSQLIPDTIRCYSR